MEKIDLLLSLLLEELLPETGQSFYIKTPNGQVENDNANVIRELLTEEVTDEFYSIIEDKLIEVLNKKYPETE